MLNLRKEGINVTRISTKDISDYQVLKAYEESKRMGFKKFPYDILMEKTGACEKVCYRAMERAYDRELIECGVSLRSGWITEKGYALMSEHVIIDEREDK